MKPNLFLNLSVVALSLTLSGTGHTVLNECTQLLSTHSRQQLGRDTGAILKPHKNDIRLLEVANHIRAQINSGTRIEKVEIEIANFMKEIRLAKLVLTRLVDSLPKELVLSSNDGHADPVLLRPNRAFAEELLKRIDHLFDTDTVKYLDFLNIMAATSWAKSIYFSKLNVRDYEIGARSIVTFSNRGDMGLGGAKKDYEWNFDSFVQRLNLVEIWEMHPHIIPIVTSEKYQADRFFSLWGQGVAPIGIHFSDQLHFDGQNGHSFSYFLHDWKHLRAMASKTDRLLPWIEAIDKLSKFENLRPEIVTSVREELHWITHEDYFTIIVTPAQAQDYFSQKINEYSNSPYMQNTNRKKALLWLKSKANLLQSIFSAD